MCSKGGGSPPVPNSASTSFQSTTTPAPFATPLYQDFLNRANAASQTPFNPAMQGTVAPLNATEAAAGNQMFSLGMDNSATNAAANNLSAVGGQAGTFDANAVRSMESPFTEDVVNATQGWFNNQNAIQGNDLLSQAIKSGNAFGGDRAGVAEGVLGGQQQLAQAPVIAGLRQAGYTQALNEFNQMKQLGLAGAQAGLTGQLSARQAAEQGAGLAMGWGTMQQQQQQREADVAQQNAMMQSAYPFQTLNWYGAALGGVAPLLGAQTVGFNTPPDQSGLGAGLGAAAAGLGVGAAAFGAGAGPTGFRRGGSVRRARGGLVPVFIRHNGGIIPGLAYGGFADGGSSDDDDDQHEPAGMPVQASDRAQSEDNKPPQVGLPPRDKAPTWGSQIGQLKGGQKQTTPSTFPGMGGGSSAAAQPTTTQTTSQWLDVGTKALSLGAKLAPLMLLNRGGGVRRFADGGYDDDQLTMTDLGVLDPQGRELSPGIAGPSRGSPAGNPEQADDTPNLARVRERFRPMLEDNPALRKKFDVNTTAEAGTSQPARDFYQALTLDRAAARGESLPYTLSRGPGTPDRYYPGVTTGASTASGQGVNPALWGGANPANFGTGNASRDPLTGHDVTFAGGPQTGSVGAERGGIEGPDLAAARRFGYRGPSTTPIGFGPGAPQGTYGGDGNAAAEAKQSYPEGAREKVGVSPEEERKQGQAGPGGTGAGTGQVGRKIPGLEKPAPSFAQRLAQNPLWQFGTALMAKPGIKGRELSAIGGAAQTMSAQQTTERNRILDEKPQMFDDGKQLHALHPDGTLTPTGLPSPKGIEARTKAPFAVETDTPGPFGSTTKKKEYYKGYDENGNPIPFQSPTQGAQQPATPRITPEERPALAPPAAPAPAPAPAPQQGAPQVRQTEASPAAQPAPPAGPTGWSQDPTTGNWRDKEGAVYDKEGKIITPAPAAAPAAPAAPGQQAPAQQPQTGVAGPDDTLKKVQTQWGSGAIKPGGAITDPAALNRNEAALEGLRPDEQRIIKGIADYSLDPNKVFAGKSANLRAPAINKVLEYDPSYNQGQYAQRNAARKAFEVNGVEARNIQSQDMAVQHAARAFDNIDALGHTRLPRVNKAIAEIGKETGLTGDPYQKAVARINQDIHAVSNELMKVFRGGTGTPSEREAKRIADTLNVYDNPVALKEALKEGVELLYGRINATAYRYNDAMGPGYARPTESWMSPEGRASVQRIMQGQ
jgi:hypothetical protein